MRNSERRARVKVSGHSTMVSVGVLMLVAAAIATLSPAVRASRVDPAVVLRAE